VTDPERERTVTAAFLETFRMSPQNEFTRSLRLSQPIIQAPLGGGAASADLPAAACEAGALGFLGAAYWSPQAIAEVAAALRRRSRGAFGINLFVPPAASSLHADQTKVLQHLAPLHEALGLPPPAAVAAAPDLFPEQLRAALDSDAALLSFTFGIPPAEAIAAIKARGKRYVGTATTVEEAVALAASGAEAIVAQGSEAGGHRASFDAQQEPALIGSMALVPQIVDAVRVPVIASGGIADGRGIVAALALGASAVQIGTAFLTCTETGFPQAHKDAILAGREDRTTVTRAFSGRPARGLANRAMRALDADRAAQLPYPLQNALTRPLRAAAAARGEAEFLSLWAGQALRLARREGAGDLVRRLGREIEQVLAGLGSVNRTTA
jgi:nitronate monooxygenase